MQRIQEWLRWVIPRNLEHQSGCPILKSLIAHDPIELKEWKREARYNNQYGIELKNAQHYDRQIDR